MMQSFFSTNNDFVFLFIIIMKAKMTKHIRNSIQH
jgi:hypothetical protein